MSEVTFRGLEIRDLEILGMGSWTEEAGFRSSQGWAEERAQWYQRTGRAQEERGPGFVGTSLKKSESTVECNTNIPVPVRRELVWI